MDDTVHDIQIREHAKVYELNLTNNKISEQPKTPDNPKTGDDFNLPLWIGIMGAALLGIGVMGALRFRRKKNNKEA